MTKGRPDAILEQAYAALEEGDFEAARRALDHFRQAEPKANEGAVLESDILLEEATDDEGIDAALTVIEKALEHSPDDPVLAAILAARLVDLLGGHEEARPLLEDALSALDREEGDPADDEELREFMVDVLVLIAECRGATQDPRGALQAAQRAHELEPKDAVAQLSVAGARFDLCDLEGALTEAEAALALEPALGDAHWLRGRVETIRGNAEAAAAAFESAREVAPDTFPPPPTISEDDLVSLVEVGLAELPAQVRDYMRNITIVVEDVPSLELLKENDPPLSPGLLGLFDGTPPALESSADPWSSFPRQITLFRKNIEVEARDEADLQELAVTTLIHEVGHYLGLDEEELAERGLA